MNRKQLTLLLIVGILVGGSGIFLYNRNNKSWQSGSARSGDRLLKEFPLNDITLVRIKNATNELNLVRVEESWRVKERYDYPAAFSEIGELLRKAWEMQPVQSMAVGPSQLGRLSLNDPTQGSTNSVGTLVEFKNKDGKVAGQLLLGKKHMRSGGGEPSPFGGGDEGWPDGRFVMVPGASQVAVIKDPLASVEPKPETWLNKDFFKIEKLKSVTLTHTNAASSWKLSREMENGEIKMADLKEGEQLDAGKSSSIGWIFSSASFADVADPKTPPSATGLDNPVTAVIETFDGFTYTVKIGAKSGEENHYFAFTVTANLPKERTPGKDEKPEDKDRLDKEFKEKLAQSEEKLKQEKAYEKWTYLIARWSVESLLKERKELLVDKKAEAAAAADAHKDDGHADDNAVEAPK